MACGLIEVVSRFRLGRTGWFIVWCAAAAATATDALAKPRTERVIERRVTRLEAMEQRLEAAAEMPPRPADVRRAIRRGEPLPPRGPKAGGAAASAAGKETPDSANRAAAPRPATKRPAPATMARPVSPRPAPQPALRFPEQPAVAQEPARPVGAAADSITPATAIDDGTRSVLVREQPTPAPAPAAELLPTPQPK